MSRPIPCLLSGVQSEHIYPLRARLKRLADSGQIPAVTRRHPGYRLQSEADCERQYAEYAAQLRQSQLSLCCTSKYRYCLAKIAESLMVGAVPVTDAPDDSFFRDNMAEFCIAIGDDWSDQQIAETINAALSKPEWIAELSAAGQEFARKELSTERYAERFYDAAQEFLGG